MSHRCCLKPALSLQTSLEDIFDVTSGSRSSAFGHHKPGTRHTNAGVDGGKSTLVNHSLDVGGNDILNSGLSSFRRTKNSHHVTLTRYSDGVRGGVVSRPGLSVA